MKSLDVLLELVNEVQVLSCANMQRDINSILSRYKDEGESFLGITLPQFCEWLEESLETGHVATWIYARFRKRPKHKSVLPCFLHGLTCRVFDAKTGARLKLIDEHAVRFIRQICLWYKKVFLVCDPVRDRKAQEAYHLTDLSLRRMRGPTSEMLEHLNNVTRRFFPKIDVAFARAIDDESILPKHGPGATADKAWATRKYLKRSYYARWNRILSWEHLYGFSTVHQASESGSNTGDSIAPRDELPVKVTSVPKTMKTSRIICVEPTAMQYAQQLTARRLVRSLVGTGLLSQLNFHDQLPNQEAARVGSIDGSLATMDLSEASDRVSVKLVRDVFRHAPLLLEHLYGCRSTRALLPNGDVHILRKYASMGSALTFPVEAICFYMVCLAAVCVKRRVFDRRGRPRSLLAFDNVRKGILVFGDDIIIPSDCIDLVTEFLSAFGLKVNAKKTFSKGPFRESCGKDYVNGVLVTPVYLRQPPPRSLRHAKSFVSWVQMGNRFLQSGYPRTAQRIREYINTMYKLPLVSETSPGLGWVSPSGETDGRLVFCKKLQATKTVVRTLVARSRQIEDSSCLDGYDRLLFFFINRGEGETYQSDPTQSPKRNSIRLHERNVSPW